MFLAAQRALRPGADLGQAIDAVSNPGRNNPTGAGALDHQEDHGSLLVHGPVPRGGELNPWDVRGQVNLCV